MAQDRALATLIGGALGDALGMPTQLLSPARIKSSYGFVDGFVVPSEDHPVSKGLPAGAITDDTEQTLLLGRILLESVESFDHKRWVGALVDWERDVKARGSYDLLGPSTKRAIDAINDGVPPEEAGREGDTNGAAMRIAPVGILMPPEPLEALVTKVVETCRATHNTSIAIASAAAVAAAVSHGIAGCDWREATRHAVDAAALGAKHGHWTVGPDVAARIGWACELVRGKSAAEAIGVIVDLVGTGVASQQSVPAAFAVLEVAEGDPWQAAVISANLGGDTDTIGAIAAGMAGACAGTAELPEQRIAELRGIDLDEIRALAADLVAARFSQAGGKEAA
jgi:ADP-ribosylglycohydrolase